MQLVFLLVHAELFPYVQDEVDGIFGMGRGIGIEELEAVLIETEDFELIIVEVGIQFLLQSHEVALVQVVPHGL